MTAAVDKRKERGAAAAIMTGAVAVALWIIWQRPQLLPAKPQPLRVVEAAEKPVSQPITAAALATLNIELVDLPAPKAAPAPAAPQPAAPPAAAPPAEAKEATPPVQVMAAAPAPQPQPEARVEPAKPFVPLRPEPDSTPKPEARPVAPLQPEERVSKAIVALKPGDEKPLERPHVAPMNVEEPPPRPQPTAKTITPLKPEPEKPVEKPAVLAEAKPVAPLRPEAVMTRPYQPPQEIRRAPEPKPEPKFEPKPEPVKMAKAEPPPAPDEQPGPPMVNSNSGVAGEGRVLLRIFEQGSGPAIEIRWPADQRQRDRLYGVFVHCLGMKIGLLDSQGHLYLAEGDRNQATVLNMDKFSGFVRRPEGAMADDEQREIARIRAYHAGIGSVPPARIFPRRVDAFLIGGLRQTVGEDYLKLKSVRAAYRLSGNRVIIDSISADGHPVDGAIDLSTVATACTD